MNNNSMPALQQLVGEPFQSVEGLFFVSPGTSTSSLDNLEQLRITLGTDFIRCRCGNDGETLTIDQGELYPSKLGEYGELRRTDLADHSLFSTLIDARLRHVSLLKSHDGHFIIGYILDFSKGSLAICNWGDELKVWHSIPEALFADEKIQIVPA